MSYVPLPPVIYTVADPSFAPLQLTESVIIFACIWAGSTSTALAKLSQPLASVIVQVYVPTESPVAIWVVCPFDQKYAYGGVPPPEGNATAVPSEKPKHPGLVMLKAGVEKLTAVFGSEILIEVGPVGSVQPLKSVIVTAYVPAVKPLIEGVVCAPGLHK